jgi:hypothetical protein
MNWFLKFQHAWLDDPRCDELPLAAQGLFVKMLVVQSRDGWVPGDTEEIARKCKCRLSEMQMHVQKVMQLFVQRSSGRYVFEPLESDMQRSEVVSRARSDAAQKRWNKGLNANASANETANQNASAQSNVDANEHRSKKLEVRSESQEIEKTFCAKPQDGSAPARSAVINLPLNDKTEHSIYESDVAEYAQLYPGVDIFQQLRNMRGWLLSNPKNRKTWRLWIYQRKVEVVRLGRP